MPSACMTTYDYPQCSNKVSIFVIWWCLFTLKCDEKKRPGSPAVNRPFGACNIPAASLNPCGVQVVTWQSFFSTLSDHTQISGYTTHSFVQRVPNSHIHCQTTRVLHIQTQLQVYYKDITFRVVQQHWRTSTTAVFKVPPFYITTHPFQKETSKQVCLLDSPFPGFQKKTYIGVSSCFFHHVCILLLDKDV